MSKKLQQNYKNWLTTLSLEQLQTRVDQLEQELIAELEFGKLANSKASRKLQIKLDLANNILNNYV